MATLGLPVPEANVLSTEPEASISMDGSPFYKGRLVVAESRLIFVVPPGETLSVDYNNICLHAVESANETFSKCIFLLLNSNHGETEEEDDTEEEDEAENPLEKIIKDKSSESSPHHGLRENVTSIRILVPESHLIKIYADITDCAVWHNQEDDVSDEEEDEEQDEFDSEENEDELGESEDSMELGHVNVAMSNSFPADEDMTSSGRRILRHLESIMVRAESNLPDLGLQH